MSIPKILLRASGRMGQRDFWIGMAVFVVLYVAQIGVMKLVGTSLPGFFISLTFLCLNIYILYSLFAKRLHDGGSSVFPFFATIIAMLILAIMLQLNSGGLEYFDSLMANPDRHDDAEWMKAQQEIYQENLKQGVPAARLILWLPGIILTLIAGLKKAEPTDNRYGPATP